MQILSLSPLLPIVSIFTTLLAAVSYLVADKVQSFEASNKSKWCHSVDVNQISFRPLERVVWRFQTSELCTLCREKLSNVFLFRFSITETAISSWIMQTIWLSSLWRLVRKFLLLVLFFQPNSNQTLIREKSFTSVSVEHIKHFLPCSNGKNKKTNHQRKFISAALYFAASKDKLNFISFCALPIFLFSSSALADAAR